MKRLVFVLTALLLVSCGTASIDRKKQSEHYQDGVFQNINPVKMHTFWEIVWAGLTSDNPRAQWPEQVVTVADTSPVNKVEHGPVRITFINHASFLIQSGGFNILTDPVFSQRTSPFSFIGPRRIHQPGIALEDLPPIDVILISHDHYDHLDLASMEALIERDNPKLYMGLGVASRLPTSAQSIELDWWQSSQVADGFKLWFLDVQHFSGRTLTDRNSTLWGGFMLDINGKKIYFGGDSGYADHYQRTYDHFGPVDIAFLPIGAYAPRSFFKPVHLNPTEAMQAHQDLHAELSIGMHYGTFQLSAEPREEPVQRLASAREKAGVSDAAFVTLEIGKPFEVGGG